MHNSGVPERRVRKARLLPPARGMGVKPVLEWAAAVAKVVTAAAALLVSSPWQPPSLLLSSRGAPSPAGPSRGDQRASCLLRIAGARHAALPVRAALAAERRRRLLLFVEGFVAAASFEGARTGFAFKTGSMGLGYYSTTP